MHLFFFDVVPVALLLLLYTLPLPLLLDWHQSFHHDVDLKNLKSSFSPARPLTQIGSIGKDGEEREAKKYLALTDSSSYRHRVWTGIVFQLE